MSHVIPALRVVQTAFQLTALALLTILALALTTASTLAALGLLPWIDLPLQYGDAMMPLAGMYLQIGLTLLAVALLFFLPASHRVMALENSHRQFSVSMNDVARAYWTAHAADRDGIFNASSEFDAVRERMIYLRNHPDLDAMEPEILELAAQMSHVSRDLAATYSDSNIARAKSFLEQRQQELERFETLLAEARGTHAELQLWRARVEIDEDVARAQLSRLRQEMSDLLAELDATDTPAPDARPARRQDVLYLPQMAAE